MKQVWIGRVGPPEVLEVRDVPDPEPGRGEVRVEVRASGVNFSDLMARVGMYPDGPAPPCVVGYEISGVVDRVGPGVDAGRLGTRVVAATRFGGYASHVVVDEAHAVPLPSTMSFHAGAALPVTGLTAWMILEEMHRVRAGDRVLIHSAGGGVGLMACELVKKRGGVAVGTASAHKHDFLREWGFDELVDYRTVDYEEALRRGPGFDLVMDPLGGEHWAKGLRLLRTGGKLVCYGMSVNISGTVGSKVHALKNILRIPWLSTSLPGLIGANKGVLGVNMGRMWNESERLVGWLEQLLRRVEEGSLRVRVHAAVPFSRAAEAHRLIHDRKNIGKVLLVPDAFA